MTERDWLTMEVGGRNEMPPVLTQMATAGQGKRRNN